MPPGRPADAQHRRMRIILGTLAAHRSHGVSRRTIMSALGKDPSNANDQRVVARDLANLRASGWHIDTERVGLEDRYRLRVVDHRLRSAFSDLERAQLLRGARAAELGQIFDDLDPSTANGPDAPGDTTLGVAQRAIEVHSLLLFEYTGKPRALHPYDIELKPGGWRLRGKEDDTGLVKVFALERVSDLYADRPGTAEPSPKDLSPLNIDPMSRHEHAPVEIVVRHAAELTNDVVSQLGAGGHRTLPTEDPEVVDSILTVTFVDSFLDRLLEMEQRVRLIGPGSVRLALRERLLGTAVLHPRLSDLDEAESRTLDTDEDSSSFGARTASPQLVRALTHRSRPSGPGRHSARQSIPRTLTMPTEISA